MRYLIILLILNLYIQASGLVYKDKPNINFYVDDKTNLMWLLYSASPSWPQIKRKEYTRWPDRSYENYIDKINNDKKRFLYSNWRLPTKDELLTLPLNKTSFFEKLFMSNEEKENSKSLRDDIFYIHNPTVNWSSTSCGEHKYYMVHFTAKYPFKSYYTERVPHRLFGHGKPYLYTNSTTSTTYKGGAVILCKDYNTKAVYRLVRDIKEK